jgi:hypothetical protein
MTAKLNLKSLGPAGQVPSLSGRVFSPLVGEQEPCFNSNILGGLGLADQVPSLSVAESSQLVGEPEICFNSDTLFSKRTPVVVNFTVSFDPQPDAQTSPLLSLSSVGTAAVGFEQGILSCGRLPHFLNPEQIAHCAIDGLALNVSEQAVVPSGGENCDPDKSHPSEQVLNPDNSSQIPAAAQVYASSWEEADDPLAQLREW